MPRSLAAPWSRYLRLLGFDEPPQGLDGLRELVGRHLCRVPFENVSKLLLVAREGAGRPTTLPEFLDGIEHRDLGGTCYSSNPFFAALLNALGYDADLLGADMDRPDIHTGIRVRLAGVEYHVDVGYAAPFRGPVPLGRLPHRIAHGEFLYVFDRCRERDGLELAVFKGAERVHGYVVHPPARSPQYFTPIILDSYKPTRTFMQCLRITRFFEDHAVELRNNTLTRYRGSGCSRTALASAAELEAAVREEMALPRCPVREALDVLERMTGRSLFGGDVYPERY